MKGNTEKKRLRIAVLVKSFITTGGSERYALEVTTRLRDRGHEIHLFARRGDSRYMAGIEHYTVPSKNAHSSVIDSLNFAQEAARLLQGKTFDVVHSHERGWQQDVLTVHTFSYKGGLYKYSWLRRLDQRYLSLRSWIYLWMEKRQMQAPYLAAVSDVIRQDIIKHYGQRKHISVIPPGVDTDMFRPGLFSKQREQIRKDAGIAEGELLILFVGDEFKRKGLDYVIPALLDGKHLLVVGRGEKLHYYQGLAKKYGKADNVHFVGHVDDVRPYYASSDVLALPSRSEAFGMTILEAMSFGLPVVTTANTGAASVIQCGKNGEVLSDLRDFGNVLNRLQDRSVLQRLGEEARKTAEDMTWEQATDRYEEIYYRVACGISSEKEGYRDVPI